MHRHYDAAYHFQSEGDLAQAISEHRLFLVDALHSLANGRANIGDYTQSVSLYDDALKLAGKDFVLYLDYAGAALDAGDPSKAERLAQAALNINRNGVKTSEWAKAHLVLGRALRAMGKYNEALEEYKAAAAIDPNFENMFALGAAYLWVPDTKSAAQQFEMLIAQFGDTADLRMKLGRAYGESGYPEQAIQEFKSALAKDSKLPGAHYSLGASYISNSGQRAYAEAEAEFHKELAIQPNDYLSYAQLGRIALSRRNFREAERDLKRAAALDPTNPDNYLSLGELYSSTNRPSDAERALRKAIALTTDPSRNHFAVQRAHYRLSRLLIERGAIEQGKKETQIARTLLLESRRHDDAILAGKPIVQTVVAKRSAPTLMDVLAVKMLEKQMAPLIARSYCNLGVDAALNRNYGGAVEFFERSYHWDPAVAGLDKSWGNAAFEAHEYAQATGPLSRSLQAQPDDIGVRSKLGLSQYMLHEYGKVLRTLQPMGTKLDSAPALAFAYADSLIKTGDFLHGMDQLNRLLQTNSENAMLHRTLAEGYVGLKDYRRAVEQLRIVVRLNPSDAEAAEREAKLSQVLESQESGAHSESNRGAAAFAVH
jgi:tetratricopeptide (TPR) repeat protein